MRGLEQWTLHEKRIKSIDFNSQNPNIMATSSTDGTACIWDLRLLNAQKPNCLNTVKHNRAVHSAYFSPSGAFLATTSADDAVGIFECANFEDKSLIYHDNQTGRWISSFKFDIHSFYTGMLAGATAGGQIYMWTST